MFYKIEECIGRGFYIVWDGIYETRESAEDEIIRRGARDAALGRTRVVQYRRGNGSNGPERVNETGEQ
jgi:hypothetical protein